MVSDAVEPRAHLRIPPELFQSFPRFDERVLANIIRVIVIEHHTADIEINRLLILIQHALEGLVAQTLFK